MDDEIAKISGPNKRGEMSSADLSAAPQVCSFKGLNILMPEFLIVLSQLKIQSF